MLQPNGQNENTTASLEVAKNLHIVNRFLSNFPPKEVKYISWNLLIYAFGSEDANGLSHLERSNMLFFYEQLNKLCEALRVIDEQLGPLFANRE